MAVPVAAAAAPALGDQAGAAGAASIHWTVLTLAMPALIDMSLQTLLLLSDLKLAGGLPNGEQMLAAVGMGTQLMMIINVLFTAVGVGAMALVARHVGAGERAEADRVARQAMILGVIIGTLTAAALVLLAPSILYGLGLRGRTLADSVLFVRTFMPGLCVGALMFMGGACLRGAGDTRGALMAVAVANVFNIAVAWTLCKGWFGLPAMGIRGIGIGTMTAYLTGGLFMLYLVRHGRRGVRVRFRPFSLDFDLIRQMLRIGVFAGLESVIFACASTAVAAIVAHPPLGTADYAAYMLTIRIEALSYLPGFAFGIAGGALVGQSLGAGRPERASHCGWTALAWGGLLMSMVGAVFVIWPDVLVQFFIKADESPEVCDKAVRMLRICGYIQPALAMLMVLPACLKGAGDTRYPAAITFGGVLGLRLPGAFVAARYLRVGVVGVWWVMMADLVIRAILMTWRFIHGGWKKVRV